MYHQVIAAMTAIAVLSFGGAHDRVQAANDSALKADILRLSHDWERVKFQVADRAEQEKQIAILELQAGDIAKRYPNHPEAIIWIGFIISEQASMAIESGGPIKALGLAMRARDILERAEKIDPVTLDAGAPTILGVLYYRVPAFPFGFGDKLKARHYLLEAIRNAPNGLDANFYYGEFLYEQHEYPEAINALRRALTLPALLDRPNWDASLRLLIKGLLAQMNSN